MSYIPEELKYLKTHEWVAEDNGLFVVGLSDFALAKLGDIVFINLPMAGDGVAAGETFADVESDTTVADIYSPVTGMVQEINEELIDNPALINEAPYDSWLIKVCDVEDTEELLDADEYAVFCESEAE